MRISDWSSDVCSSDLVARPAPCPNAHSCPRPCRVPRTAFRQTRGRAGCPVAGSARAESRTPPRAPTARSEEHTSELQSLMRISYAVFCLKKKKKKNPLQNTKLKKQMVTQQEKTIYK